ncbi:MAG: PAS domain S-box protein [Polyangiaceae bacterium]|nr:PAS domain S-box protein [Polyangiaceae bacterium]
MNQSRQDLVTEVERLRARLAELEQGQETCMTSALRDSAQALRESETRYRSLCASMTDALVRVSMDGRIIESNQVFQDLVGYSSEQLEKLTHLDLTPDRWHAMERRVLDEQVLIRGCSEVYQKEYRHKDGRILRVELRTFLQRDAQGVPADVWSIVREITDPVRLADGLRPGEDRFRIMSDQLYPGIVIVQNRRVTFANPAVAEILGYPIEEIRAWSGQDFHKLVYPDDLPYMQSLVQRRLDNPSVNPMALEFRAVTKSGEVRWLEQYGRDIVYEGAPAILYTLLECSARKLAELRLAEEKQMLSFTLRSICEGVITTDMSSRVVLMNGAAEKMTGWTQAEAAGRLLQEVYPFVARARRKTSDSAASLVLLTGEAMSVAQEGTLSHRDGHGVACAERAAPIRDGKGAVIGAVVVFHDVTQEQQLQASLQRSAKLESLGVLAAGIAHDFNNLIGGLWGYIELARESCPQGHQTRGYLDQAVLAFDRAKALTHQLLTFAKGGVPVRQAGSIAQLVRQSTEFALSGSAISCSFDFAPDLWSVDHDKHQLAQVIDNIIINAKQAMPLGGRIVLRAHNVVVGPGGFANLPGGRYVRLSISDPGVGMPKELLSNIFDPFFSTKHQGSGLGLTTAYAIVRNHDGTIEAESEPGQGSTFHVYLPASEQAEVDRVSAAGLPVHEGSGVVVVMDDDTVIRKVLSEMLSSMGYRVVETTDGREAIDAVTKLMQQGSPLVGVILDLTVRGGPGGLEAIGEIRRIAPTLPVVASSGYSEDAVIADPFRFGFTASLSKPFRMEDLGAVLHRTILPTPS